MTLGLCMIVKDEAAVLGRCLDSAAGVFDEIIIVDTGSTDATKEIARRYTKDVFDFAWRQDFAAARNFSFAKATADYCMWLDADEVLLPKDAAALRALKETLSGAIGRYFLRTVIPAADGSCALTFERARIVRRGTALWQGRSARGYDRRRRNYPREHFRYPPRQAEERPFPQYPHFCARLCRWRNAQRKANVLFCA